MDNREKLEKLIWTKARETVEKHCGDKVPGICMDREFMTSMLATYGNEIAEIFLRKHIFWGAGEKDCPRDIKAGNGELHTLRCKVCGQDGSRGICFSEG